MLNNFIKILEVSYGKGNEVKKLVEKNKIQEADKMVCDMIENAKLEREEPEAKGELKKLLK